MKFISPDIFLRKDSGEQTQLLDVRTPKEFEEGHIHSAVNLPLFTDEERAIIGTTYKQKGKRQAILEGLAFTGPRMADMVREASKLSGGKPLSLYCWRGGMRSGSVGWLLDTAGLDIQVIRGGYKALRKEMRKTISDTPWKIVLLGGRTGTGKTHLLHRLKEAGEQIIDLEHLAHHKGSAFGWIGESGQPSTAQFFNDLYYLLSKLDSSRPIWVEAESSNIGKVRIPEEFWKHMQKAPRIDIRIPDTIRIRHLVEDYGEYAIEDLIQAFTVIRKRLGGNSFKQAIEGLQRGDLDKAARLALYYYDKTYDYSREHSPNPALATFDYNVDWKTLDLAPLIHKAKNHFHG